MKSKGFTLIETLISIFILSCLTVSFIPAAERISEALSILAIRTRCLSDGIFVCAFMTEKLRNQTNRGLVGTNELHSVDICQFCLRTGEKITHHEFFEEKEKWKIRLSDGQGQPLTGETDNGSHETFGVTRQGLPYFDIYGEGLICFRFSVVKWTGYTHQYDVMSAILPYSDYFFTGEIYGT